MNSLDNTSLYTNKHIKKFLNLLDTHLKIKFDTPLPTNTLFNICKHITSMIYFKKFYKQKHVVPMGNPLS